MAPSIAELVERARAGSPRAVARLISLVEDASPALREVMAALVPHAGGAAVVGVTGSPGVGKSSLLAMLARSRAFDTVAVDATFYAIPPAATLRDWASRVGEAFQFALKMPQEITHENRLRHVAPELEQFLLSARELPGGRRQKRRRRRNLHSSHSRRPGRHCGPPRPRARSREWT